MLWKHLSVWGSAEQQQVTGISPLAVIPSTPSHCLHVGMTVHRLSLPPSLPEMLRNARLLHFLCILHSLYKCVFHAGGAMLPVALPVLCWAGPRTAGYTRLWLRWLAVCGQAGCRGDRHPLKPGLALWYHGASWGGKSRIVTMAPEKP